MNPTWTYARGAARASVFAGDCRATLAALPEKSVHCCVTSPPYYGLRDYGVGGQIGLEQTPDEYVAAMVDVFRAVRRVLRDDGTCWVNLGDSYSGSSGSGGATEKQTTNSGSYHGHGVRAGFGTKPKDLLGIPWRVAFALQADGWYLRQDIIWAKPAPMPESVRDRCTKAHEYIFLLTKSPRYFYDADAIAGKSLTAGKVGGFTPNSADASGMKRSGNMIPERGKSYIRPSSTNARSVWRLSPSPYKEAHFATFPPELPKRCILAGTSERGACAACGAPWRRVVERKSMSMQGEGYTKGSGRNDAGGPGSYVTRVTADYWQLICDCNAATVPCTVLDPFNGSGTTLAVALSLGRSGIGCELNPQYVEMSVRRIVDYVNEPIADPVKDAPGQASLFEVA